MKTVFAILIIFFNLGLLFSKELSAQEKFTEHIVEPYVSDGQKYISGYDEDGLAEFDVVFYGGTKYRIAYGDSKGFTYRFRLIDQEGNELFSQNEYEITPYWDFTFTDTMPCKVQIKRSALTKEQSLAEIAIGYSQNHNSR